MFAMRWIARLALGCWAHGPLREPNEASSREGGPDVRTRPARWGTALGAVTRRAGDGGVARSFLRNPVAHGSMGSHDGAGPHSMPVDHRPHRPRQVDARRPAPRADRRGRPARHARPVPRLDGPRA